MWKLKSDKGFLEYLRANGKTGVVLLIGILSLMLIFLSSAEGERTEKVTTEEERCEKACSMSEGVGECRVMMTFRDEKAEQPYAVLVLCQNADSPKVREKITSLFTSLYGIGSHRVEIQELSRQEIKE